MSTLRTAVERNLAGEDAKWFFWGALWACDLETKNNPAAERSLLIDHILSSKLA
jgi:hypothetical protein